MNPTENKTSKMAKNLLLQDLLKTFVSQFGVYLLKYRYPLTAVIAQQLPEEVSAELADRGLDQKTLEEKLNAILAADFHLKACCANPLNMAYALDLLFWPRFNFPSYADYPGDSSGEFDKSLGELEKELYANEFQRFSCFHLFNLEVSGGVHDVASLFPEWAIREFPPDVVANMIGEKTLSSFLSPSKTGKFFLVAQDNVGLDQESMYDWLAKKWKEAAVPRQILQYAKDSVVDIDYVVPYFMPAWVNDVHRAGLYFLGFPRQDVPFMRYQLAKADCSYIGQLYQAHKAHKGKIEDFASKLRRAIGTAGNFYEDFHSKGKRVEQFASLVIALEALYTPEDQGELTYRIRQSCAVLLGKTPEEREEIFRFLNEIFKLRGKLFHGKYAVSAENPEPFIADESLIKLASIARRSILSFIAFYLNGETKLSDVQGYFPTALLNQEFGDTVRKKADLGLFLASLPNSASPVIPIGPSDN